MGRAGAAGKMAAVGMAAAAAKVACRRWGWTAVSCGFHRGLCTLLAQKPEKAPRWLPGQCPKDGNGERSFEHHPGSIRSFVGVFGAPFKNAPVPWVPQSRRRRCGGRRGGPGCLGPPCPCWRFALLKDPALPAFPARRRREHSRAFNAMLVSLFLLFSLFSAGCEIVREPPSLDLRGFTVGTVSLWKCIYRSSLSSGFVFSMLPLSENRNHSLIKDTVILNQKVRAL